MSSPTSQDSAGPGVRFPPPFLFALGFLLGLGLDRMIPWRSSPRLELVGALLIAAGLALAASGAWTFFRARTAIIPHKPASRLVIRGPYRFTRNPMYVGLTTTYVGIALAIHRLWPLAVLPLVLAALVRFVVRREEAYLSSKFGRDYDDYRRTVRRWL
jgi:protein-S-isoprenylcysteine O-methyltransferase Ste14